LPPLVEVVAMWGDVDARCAATKGELRWIETDFYSSAER
jgi:hypothetical protein